MKQGNWRSRALVAFSVELRRPRNTAAALVVVLLIAVAIGLNAWIYGETPVPGERARGWLAVGIGCLALLYILHREERRIDLVQPSRRIPWRLAAILAWVCLALSLLQWPPVRHMVDGFPTKLGAVVATEPVAQPMDQVKRSEAVVTYSNDSPVSRAATDNVADDINRWGTLFAWLLGIMALVIAFVTSWVYSIAKEAKEQVAAIHGVVDLRGRLREASSDLRRMELYAEIDMLLEVLNPRQYHEENMRLRLIRTAVAQGANLLFVPTDLNAAAEALDAALGNLEAGLDPPRYLDERYRQFLHGRLQRYLAGLHEQLQRARVPEKQSGQRCMEAIERLWRMAAT